jgi:hypothetical protein
MHLLHRAPTCRRSRAATIAAGTAAVSASTAAACPISLIVACPRSFCCCLPPPYRLLLPLPPLKRLQRLSPSPSALVAVAIDLPPLHLPSLSPASLIAIATAHIIAVAIARPPPSLPSLLPPSPPPSSLHDTFIATLFWPPSPSPSAVATATTNAIVSTAVTVNSATAASIFTDVCLCFCHNLLHRYHMCRSHHDCRFCHSRSGFLVDCSLTHHCPCSANAFANAATSRCAFASHSPGWLLHGFSSRHNLLTCHRLSTRRLVVVSPLVAPPSHFPRLVVASPLFAPPLPLNAPAAASRRVIPSPRVGSSYSLSPFVKNNPPPRAGFSFRRWTPADE